MATSTITKNQPSVDGELRIPRVEANLLPIEVIERRRGRLARRIVITGLIAVTVLTAGWYAVARFQAVSEADAVRYAEDDAQRVVRQQREYGDLVATRAESQAIAARLSGLLAGDLPWAKMLYSIRTNAPAGVTVTGIVGSLNDDPASLEATAARTKGATIGRLTVSGTGTDQTAVAAYTDRLAGIPGLANPLVTSATVVAGVVQFSVQLDITTAALGGRYTPEGQ